MSKYCQNSEEPMKIFGVYKLKWLFGVLWNEKWGENKSGRSVLYYLYVVQIFFGTCLFVCGRRGFDPWVGKIPWRRAWQPTPVFLPGEFPWTEELGRLKSMGSQRVGHDWATKPSTNDTRLLRNVFRGYWYNIDYIKNFNSFQPCVKVTIFLCPELW